MGFISHHEIEWRLVGDGMRAVVVHEFSMGDFICPGTRVRPTKDLKVNLNLLVNLFCFAVRLGVVRSGKG